MNAKVTATIAVAVVALMVFAAAGSTTYSWFSDSEETDINITTAKVAFIFAFIFFTSFFHMFSGHVP